MLKLKKVEFCFYLGKVGIVLASVIIFGTAVSRPAWSEESDKPDKKTEMPLIELWTGSLANCSVGSLAGTDFTSVNFLGMGLGSGSIVGIPSPSIGYFLSPHFEGVLSVNLSSINKKLVPSSTTTSIYKFSGGFVYNFSDKTEKSFYLGAQAGVAILEYNDTSQDYFMLTSQFGKRWRLVQNISYSPSVLFEMISTLPTRSLSLAFIPLQFSLFF